MATNDRFDNDPSKTDHALDDGNIYPSTGEDSNQPHPSPSDSEAQIPPSPAGDEERPPVDEAVDPASLDRVNKEMEDTFPIVVESIRRSGSVSKTLFDPEEPVLVTFKPVRDALLQDRVVGGLSFYWKAAATNWLVKELKAERRRNQVDLGSSETIPAPKMDTTLREIDEIVSTLDESLRSIILGIEAGLTLKQISESLGLTPDQVRYRKKQVQAKLRKALDA